MLVSLEGVSAQNMRRFCKGRGCYVAKTESAASGGGRRPKWWYEGLEVLSTAFVEMTAVLEGPVVVQKCCGVGTSILNLGCGCSKDAHAFSSRQGSALWWSTLTWNQLTGGEVALWLGVPVPPTHVCLVFFLVCLFRFGCTRQPSAAFDSFWS